MSVNTSSVFAKEVDVRTVRKSIANPCKGSVMTPRVARNPLKIQKITGLKLLVLEELSRGVSRRRSTKIANTAKKKKKNE